MKCDCDFLLLRSNFLGCLLFVFVGFCLVLFFNNLVITQSKGVSNGLGRGVFFWQDFKKKKVKKGKVNLIWKATKVVPQHFFQ